MSVFTLLTCSAAPPTLPVAAPSCSIWSYVSSSVLAAGCTMHRHLGGLQAGRRRRRGRRRAPPGRGRSFSDGLDVRLEAGQVRLRRLGRVVRLVVDGDHLRAGADGEQHLGGRRRERDDLGRLLGMVTAPSGVLTVTGNVAAAAVVVAAASSWRRRGEPAVVADPAPCCPSRRPRAGREPRARGRPGACVAWSSSCRSRWGTVERQWPAGRTTLPRELFRRLLPSRRPG